MLYLAELPEQIGAFHGVGTNGIVMNKKALDAVIRSARTIRQINSYVYWALLEEYLLALGYAGGSQVRRIIYETAKENFGEDHPATEIARKGKAVMFPSVSEPRMKQHTANIELITDFDRSADRYIK